MECKTGNCLQYQSSIWSMNYQWKYSSTPGQKLFVLEMIALKATRIASILLQLTNSWGHYWSGHTKKALNADHSMAVHHLHQIEKDKIDAMSWIKKKQKKTTKSALLCSYCTRTIHLLFALWHVKKYEFYMTTDDISCSD